MNAKISIIAGAVVLALAGNANAAIVSNQATWGADQLFLSVYDSVSQTSYTRGLGETVGSLMSGAGLTFGGTAKLPVITGSDTVANSYSLAADANLTSFLSANKADAASIQWSVIGGGAPTNTYGTTGYVSTSNNMSTGWNSSLFAAMNAFNGGYINAAGTGVNALMPSAVSNTDSITAAVGITAYTLQVGNGMGPDFNGNYVVGVNTNMGASALGNTDSSTAIVGSNAYTMDPTSGMQNNFGTFAPFTNNASLGQAQDFYIMTPTLNAHNQFGGAAGLFQFGNANGMSTFNLSSTGNLSYSVATPTAAVPEPGEWAMLVSGLAMLGFIGTRRSKKA